MTEPFDDTDWEEMQQAFTAGETAQFPDNLTETSPSALAPEEGARWLGPDPDTQQPTVPEQPSSLPGLTIGSTVPEVPLQPLPPLQPTPDYPPLPRTDHAWPERLPGAESSVNDNPSEGGFSGPEGIPGEAGRQPAGEQGRWPDQLPGLTGLPPQQELPLPPLQTLEGSNTTPGWPDALPDSGTPSLPPLSVVGESGIPEVTSTSSSSPGGFQGANWPDALPASGDVQLPPLSSVGTAGQGNMSDSFLPNGGNMDKLPDLQQDNGFADMLPLLEKIAKGIEGMGNNNQPSHIPGVPGQPLRSQSLRANGSGKMWSDNFNW